MASTPNTASIPSQSWAAAAAVSPGSVLLRTARPDAENRQSFLFTEPLRILSAHSSEEIPAIFSSMEEALQTGHYVAGFLTYEAGYHFEPAALRPAQQPAASGLPLVWFGVYRAPLVCDAGEEIGADAEFSAANLPRELSVGISRADYTERIQRIRRYIEAGDLYQANFIISMRQAWTGDQAALFEKMMQSQPVAYGALINTGQAQILSASPELFFRRQGDRILVRPMKGTARRGRDLEEDAQRAQWLRADEKNRAENLMIVDLLRNDLGRICRPGSVEVTDLFAIERYPELLQMTSTVQGELKPGMSYYEIFRSLFPCGSITGAPKIRTMQVIRELEREPRGIACGAIGFFSPAGDAVFSVAIRTLTLSNGECQMRVGSGITYDSDPEAEYEECLLKSKFLTRSTASFQLIETIRWENGFFLLDLHLERLRSSTEYFAFRFDPDSARGHLDRCAAEFAADSVHRVRLLLSRGGEISVTSQPLAETTGPATLLLSAERTDSADPFFRHKTTRRELCDRALADARARGFDDALFLNERGEVTECAIHNVMIRNGGKLLMPPLDCGLLPGVYRHHLLETEPEIEEAVLTLDDVLTADEVFIFNSVRGLRRVRHIQR